MQERKTGQVNNELMVNGNVLTKRTKITFLSPKFLVWNFPIYISISAAVISSLKNNVRFYFNPFLCQIQHFCAKRMFIHSFQLKKNFIFLIEFCYVFLASNSNGRGINSIIQALFFLFLIKQIQFEIFSMLTLLLEEISSGNKRKLFDWFNVNNIDSGCSSGWSAYWSIDR